MLASDGNHRSSIGRRVGSSGEPDHLLNWDADQLSNEVIESAGKMLYADYVDAGQMSVVLANKFGGVIFHEACGHLLETTQSAKLWRNQIILRHFENIHFPV